MAAYSNLVAKMFDSVAAINQIVTAVMNSVAGVFQIVTTVIRSVAGIFDSVAAINKMFTTVIRSVAGVFQMFTTVIRLLPARLASEVFSGVTSTLHIVFVYSPFARGLILWGRITLTETTAETMPMKIKTAILIRFIRFVVRL